MAPLPSTLRARLRAALPRGGWLPDDQWQQRHRAIVRIVWAHAVGLGAFSLYRGNSLGHTLIDVAPILGAAAIASLPRLNRKLQATTVAIGMAVASALFVHLSGGVIEVHFHYFVVLAIMSLYQDWLPFLVSLCFVVVDHSFHGATDPAAVYNHPAAINNPWKWAAIHAAFLLAAAGANVVAWRKNEESRQALAEAEARYRALVQRSSDLTMVVDPGGTLSYVSPAALDVLGIDSDDLVGGRLEDLAVDDDRAALRAQLDQACAGAVQQPLLPCRFDHADGSVRHTEVMCTGSVDDPVVGGVIVHVRDVTDRQRLQAELRHAQKLESVGQLASGIAHEINTPIQFIGDNVRFLGTAFADLARAVGPAADPDTDFVLTEAPLAIAQTLEGVDRVATIVRAMKAFGHPSAESKSHADLNKAVRNTLIVASNEVKYVARVETDLGELPPVWCHPGDVNQVLLNLIVNAAQAIGERGAREGDGADLGVIQVRTHLDEGDAVVEVSDTGGGVPDEIADRIFEPFFTTKEVGKGTGQGLALAHTLICDRHGGSIRFTSVPGAGTTFVVRLPVEIDHRADLVDVLA